MDIATKMLGVVKQGFGSGAFALGGSLIGYYLFYAWIKWRELKIRREVSFKFLEFAGTLATENEKRNVAFYALGVMNHSTVGLWDLVTQAHDRADAPNP